MSDSSGSKYSAESHAPITSGSTSSALRPPVASKPVFTPTRPGGIAQTPTPHPKPATTSNVDDDGWGPDAPPVTRTQLEKVQPAYQPTRVNLQHLKAENQPPTYRQSTSASNEDRSDVVRGAYQPVGKVDIAAIRRQAAEAGDVKDERPTPVKGTYEPVGKVDIAAIRARAQKPEGAAESSTSTSSQVAQTEPVSLPERPVANSNAERLTNLPKPKVANKFGGGPSFPGTKPPLPAVPGGTSTAAAAQVGSASRTFADEGGKTPAQLWAERKARERGGASPSAEGEPRPVQSQTSGQGEWKSTYSGKTWAPVQTVRDKAVASQAADVRATESHEAEEAPTHVRDIRDQFAQQPSAEAAAPPVPQASRPVPVPGLPTGPSEPETEHDSQQVLPTPPPQTRSPTPPTPPVRESSPIQVAMPVSRGVADARDEQQSPPPAMPVQSLQEAVPDEKNLEDDTHDLGRAAAEATAADHPQGGLRALVQYDYEKAEDNEVELREGEYVTDIEMVDKDWWLGVNARGERGLFPGNYVEIVEDEQPSFQAQDHVTEPASEPEPQPEPVPAPPPAATPTSIKGPTATALYDYEAAEDNELSFPEDAKIVNVVCLSAAFVDDAVC